MMTMMKRCSLLLVVALVAIGAHAQLLWKVSGNGLARPSYILGTHHLAPASMLEEIPGMNQAFEGCDVVVGEIEQKALTSPDGKIAALQAVIAPADSTLDKLLSPEEYQLVEKAFKKSCGGMALGLPIPFSMLNRLKPAAVSMIMLMMPLMGQVTGHTEKDFIDMAVQKRAGDMGRPTLGLETLEEQIGLAFNSPLTEQAEMLVYQCQQEETEADQSENLLEAYKSQDMSRLEIFTTYSSSEVSDKWVYDRNRNWVEKLVTMMPERACLVCVGAGHLPGDQGLLQLLRDEGYTVEPMK